MFKTNLTTDIYYQSDEPKTNVESMALFTKTKQKDRVHNNNL